MARRTLALKTTDGTKVPRRGRPPKPGADTGRKPFRFNPPTDAADQLRKLHADTFPDHLLQLGPWLLKGVCAHYGVSLPPPGKPGPKAK